MTKLTIAIVFLLSIPVTAGLAWLIGGMFPRMGVEAIGWSAGILGVPLTFLAVALVKVDER